MSCGGPDRSGLAACTLHAMFSAKPSAAFVSGPSALPQVGSFAATAPERASVLDSAGPSETVELPSGLTSRPSAPTGSAAALLLAVAAGVALRRRQRVAGRALVDAAAARYRRAGARGIVTPLRAEADIESAAAAAEESAAAAEAAAAESSFSEAEKMFKEAYEAEFERSLLLKMQLESALSEKFREEGDIGIKISVEAVTPMGPTDPGGKKTWREAYEAAKGKTKSLEGQLKKAKGMTSGAPAPAPQAAPAEPAKPREDSSQKATSRFGLPLQGGPSEETFSKFDNLAQNVIEDEAATGLIGVPILTQFSEDSTARLPPSSKVFEVIGKDQFAMTNCVEFERVYVLEGTISSGVKPSTVLETLNKRCADSGLSNDVEILLQRSRQEGQSLLFVMLKEDLPKGDFEWYQWALCLILLLSTLLSVNATTFSVALSSTAIDVNDVDSLVNIISKTLPTAVSIFGTVAAQEVARRAAAAKYGVELTPPFFIPTWPIPSVGSLGAISRRLSLVPSNEASFAMSAAAGFTGYLVASLILFAGLSMGPDPDKIVNLNFQMLPLVLKAVMRPLLGQSSVSDQPDPFADPVSIAFPANALTIGGIVSLIVVSLNMLPVGRLDGGAIARAVLSRPSDKFIGFAALGLLLAGSLQPNDAGSLYLTFGLFTLVFQAGSEVPARDSVTELDGTFKVLGGILLLAGVLLSLPGGV